ncbi:30S ribosomal S17P protein [Fusarium beomiforme]|uniref:30S ribosomal S17P protein n=1 Tax=Fusarium beomiforme TaxID=44412 RepID=A0A9P5E0G2_9HYPO|nr:30S ribosomal S17P protein [Fusarium beomiforme]
MGSKLLFDSTSSDNGMETEQSIISLRQTVDSIPENDPDRPQYFSELATRLRDCYFFTNGNIDATEFESKKDENDLDEAIKAFKRAVDVSKEDGLYWNKMVTDLGKSIHTRYTTTRSLGDLSECIDLARRAVKDAADDDPEKVDLVINLIIWLREENKEKGSLSTSGEAIGMAQDMIKSSPEDHPSRGSLLHLIAASFSDRYVLTGSMDDLNGHIDFSRQAIHATPIEDSEWLIHLSGLAAGLSDRYLRTGALVDLEEAIKIAKTAFEKTQEGSDDWATHACNLSGYLRTRYQRLGEQLDLDTSIELGKVSVMVTENEGPLRHIRLGNLTASLMARADSTGSLADLEECVKIGHWAVEATPREHIERPARLHDLACIMQRRYQFTEDLEDLDHAIHLTQQALFSLGPNHPQQAETMSLMALFFAKRFGETDSSDDLQKTEFFYREALSQTQSPITTRIEAGVKLISVCTVQKKWEQAYEDAKAVVDLIPQMAGRSLDSSDKQDLLHKISGVSSEAAGLALHLGEDPLVALSLLEKGRGILSLSLGEIRSDISCLEERFPDLANRFVLLREQLSETPGVSSDVDYSETTVNPSRRYEAANEFEGLLTEIRQKPGFNNFLLPPSESEIKHAAERGPIIIVNTSMLRNDAILVESHRIWSVPLPDFNRRYMIEVASSYHSSIQAIIRGRKRTGSRAARSHALLVAMEDTPGSSRLPFASNSSPFIAYLSACGTGRIENNELTDEGIHLINGFHTAGFRHVIGTLWEVKDEICVDMAKVTYQRMLDMGMTDEAVSQGLHNASRELRDRWMNSPKDNNRATGGLYDEGNELGVRGDCGRSEGMGNDGLARDIVSCDEDPVWPPWIPYIHYGV